jgi:signal transduction histidine kinase
MLGDIGHDIKNMLMPILSGADLLQEDLDEYFGGLSPRETNRSKRTQEFSLEILGMIRTGARRIQERVREIADAVKGARSPLRLGPSQLAPVVASVFEALRVLANEKGLTFRTEGLDDLPTIQADDTRLFNAFYNLINNAIPEVPAGGSVTVRGQTDSSGKAVVLSISDTGRGMPPELRDSLFTSRVVSRKAGGTGLGIKIVKDVVDAHGGSIAVESEEGKGTTFRLQLHIAGPEIPTERPSVAPVTLSLL